MNLNKVYIIGRIVRDAELKSTTNGSSVVNLDIASNRVWNDKEKGKQEETEFHKVVAFGKLAEIIGKYCLKGGLLMVEGRLKTSQWEKDGVKKYKTSIIAESIQLGPKTQSKAEDVDEPGGKKIESGYMENKATEDLPVLEGEEQVDTKGDDIPF